MAHTVDKLRANGGERSGIHSVLYYTNKYYLIFLSAFLYSISFIFHSYFWWLIFLFPLPLFYALIQDYTLAFTEGFLWAYCIACMHSFCCLYVIAVMAQEYWYYGIVIGMFFVMYFSIVTGLLWYVCSCVIIRLQGIKKIYCFVVLLAVQFFIFDRYLLTPFGIVEGYPLLNPLYLLVHIPYYYQNKYQKNCNTCFDNIVVITDSVCCDSPYHSCLVIAHAVQKALENNPSLTTIIMPESFLCGLDEDSANIFSVWSQKMLGKKITVIGGGDRQDGASFYNCLYWIHNGKVRGIYDKTHTMLLSERLPTLCSFLSFMYRSPKKREVAVASAERFLITTKDGFSVTPYICSEFFFSHALSSLEQEGTILVVVNDSLFIGHWLSAYGADLLLLLARYKALLYKRAIIYVGYRHASFITSGGEPFELERIKLS
jgi:predicted amidohydrolase